MKNCLVILAILFLASVPAHAQPVIADGGVLNAAGLILPGLPNHGIAQGSLFIVKGQNLGPADLVADLELPWSAELVGTSVEVTVGGTTVSAFLYYSWTSQVAGVLPSSIPVGDGTITVTYNGQTSAPAPIHVVRSALGIFTRSASGFGPAILRNWNSETDQPLNSLNESARPGQVAYIWATGLGPISGGDSDAPLADELDVNVEILIGNKSAPVLWKGRAGVWPGIDQINFNVPEGVEGCRVPLVAMVDGVASNYTTMSIASSGKECSDSVEFSSGTLQNMNQKGHGKIGVIQLLRARGELVTPLGPLPVSFDIGLGGFYQRNMVEIQAARGFRGNILQADPPSLGTCNVHTFRDVGELRFQADDPVNLMLQDGGPALTVSGQQAPPKQIPAMAPGMYSGVLGGGLPGGEILPEYLVDGQYTITNGSGGAGVGQFSTDLTIPPMVSWTGREGINEVQRNQNLTLTWSGGDPTREFVLIIGSSTDLPKQVAAVFVCTERVSAGSFTVPSRILSSLPVSSPWTFEGLPPGSLVIGSSLLSEHAQFQIPGFDAAFRYHTSLTVRNVEYK